MSGSMYMVRGEELIEMSEQPYGLESHLQEWIAQHPPLLAGDQMNSENPRRWILIGRELAIPSELDGLGRWPIDHLFIDQDAIPTIVEAKRSSNPEIRRQVVGQMIDYAANAVRYLPISSIRSRFEATCIERKTESSEKLSDLLGPDTDDERVEQFWELVESNLQAGRIRLVFVGDIIPPELRRAVEYLNDQMRDAEVLAVEVKQFKGEGVVTLVPRVIGQTVQTQEKKSKIMGASVSQRQWDEQQFIEAFSARNVPTDVNAMRKLLDWSRSIGILWGKGKTDEWGSFYPELMHNGIKHYVFGVWTSGGVELEFERMKTRPPFDQENLRADFATRLGQIPGMRELPVEMLEKRPNFPISLLADPSNLDQFLSVCDWYCETVRLS